MKIPVDKLVFDKTNPNIMTLDQKEGLKKFLLKVGNLAPILVNNKFEIIDGEWRATIYIELGIKTIPAFQVDVKRGDQVMIRHLMNTLGGTHDALKEADAFEEILKAGLLPDMSTYLAENEKKFLDILKAAEQVGQEGLEKESEINDALDLVLNVKFKNANNYDLVMKRLMNEDSESLENALVKVCDNED